MKTVHWIGIGFLLGLGILYLHWADQRDEAMMRSWDKCNWVESINGNINCSDE